MVKVPPKVLLSKLGTLKKGGAILREKLRPEGAAVILYGDIYTKYSEIVTRFVSRVDLSAVVDGVRLNPGDIVFAGSGETAEEIGKCIAYVGNEEAYAGGDVVILSNHGQDARYLGYALNAGDAIRQKMRLGQGSSVMHLYKDDVGSIQIPLPPLAEQRKIAEILQTWDEAIEIAEAELKVKQELLKRAVAKYFEQAHREAAAGRIGELKTLDAVCARKGEYGAAVSACPYNPEWPRYVRITDITDVGILKKERAVSISPESAEGYSLMKGDLLFARTGEPGRCLYFNESYQAAFAGYLIRFKARPEVVLSEYIYYYTLSSVYEKWVSDVSQKGAQANINAKVYGSLQLPVLDLAVQEAAVRAFKALQDSSILAEGRADLLRTQKRGLMQKLLTGEVRVAS